jgi:hypothetical protein
LFASARGSDAGLACDVEFQATFGAILRTCFVGNLRGYVRDIDAYVQPFAQRATAMPFGSNEGGAIALRLIAQGRATDLRDERRTLNQAAPDQPVVTVRLWPLSAYQQSRAADG